MRKIPTRLFCKAGLLHVVRGIKTKISAKFRALWRLGFEDTKKVCHPKCAWKVSETGPRWLTFRHRDTLLCLSKLRLHIITFISKTKPTKVIMPHCSIDIYCHWTMKTNDLFHVYLCFAEEEIIQSRISVWSLGRTLAPWYRAVFKRLTKNQCQSNTNHDRSKQCDEPIRIPGNLPTFLKRGKVTHTTEVELVLVVLVLLLAGFLVG